ncbi:MAG TPA: DUF6263 family protein [Ignavibacteria bacterium]|nr:DUF6263 family protein [Ignavibacteria bacterium]HMR40506.1 DUF6263 family protein [Ignavibacteria bacterium]
MKKHYTHLITFCFLFQSLILLAQESGDTIEPQDKDTFTVILTPDLNSDLITKDETGTKVNLRIIPILNDVLRYNIRSSTTSIEKSTETNDKKIISTEETNYFYTEEVFEISSAGIITFKIKFDSIIVVSTVLSDSEERTIYNSNMKNYIWSHPDFIHYSSFIHEDFFIRVSSKGEVTSTYGMEKMYENLYSAIGDTLTINQKEDLKNYYNQDYFINILQSQFQIFPEKTIYEDYGWVRSFESEIFAFPIRNDFNYKLTDIKQNSDEYIVTVDAGLSIKVLDKKVNDEDISYELQNSAFSGKANYDFNLSRGCLVNKLSETSIELKLKISDNTDSIQSYFAVKNYLSVILLQ